MGIIDPCRRPIWHLLREFFVGGKSLEIGPGYLPTIPIVGSHFVDLDIQAMRRLEEAGGRALASDAAELPYRSEVFDLVCAFDVLEHIEDDRGAFAKIYRVLKEGGIFAFSVPIFAEYWSTFDDLAGHRRRYHPADLEILLETTGFKVKGFVCPRNFSAFVFERRLLRLPMVGLRAILEFVSARIPVCLPCLWKLYVLSPINRIKGMDCIHWGEGHLSEIRNQYEVFVICQKNNC